MAKNRKNDMDSFAGIFQVSNETKEEIHETKESLHKTKEPVVKVKQEVKSEGPKKPGRPKLNKEVKKRYTFTIRPSICENAQRVAAENGESLSEVVERILTDYIGMN